MSKLNLDFSIAGKSRESARKIVLDTQEFIEQTHYSNS